MAFPKWKTSPDFVLASNKKESQEARHDPKVQRERMNMFKRQLAANRTRGTEEAMRRKTGGGGGGGGGVGGGVGTQRTGSEHTINSFVTRSMVEALREERVADGSLQKEEPEDSDAVQISADDWPFVYFVVALDQMPAASDDMAEYKVSKTHTAKDRQRILAARKRRIQQSREEQERLRESGIDTGLRLEPLRPPNWTTGHQTPQHTPGSRRKRVFQTRHPTTPISSQSNRDCTPQRGDFFLNPADQLTLEDMMCRGFSQWFSDTFSAHSQSLPASRAAREAWEPAKTPQQHPLSVNAADQATNGGSLELPDIVSEQTKRKANDLLPNSAPGTAVPSPINSKQVNFEGLPFIKGNGIVVLQAKSEPGAQAGENAEAETTASLSKTSSEPRQHGGPLQAPWSAPLTSRSLSTMAPRSKLFRHLPIPKIDIVSEIYDELIIKTIQSFLEREGYSPERFSNLRNNIMARLAATYPHLARHRAWKLVRKDTAENGEGTGSLTETDERTRMRLRPLHQGFFAAHSVSDIGADFAKENDACMVHLPHGSRNPQDQIRPRWVPVLPASRPASLQAAEERSTSAMFMSVDGRHMAITPRDEVRYKTPTLPGATSDYRMAPLVLRDDRHRPAKTWTHIIPSGV